MLIMKKKKKRFCTPLGFLRAEITAQQTLEQTDGHL